MTMDWSTMGGWMWAGMFIWMVLGIATLVLLVVATLWIAARMRAGGQERSGPHRIGPDPEALADLERRYARGEIDRESFLTARRDLLERH